MTDDPFAHVLTVRQWQVVDAVLDNLGAVERVGGDEAVAERAGRLREVGWAANRAHPRAGSGRGGWPATDDIMPIELSSSDWQFARGAVVHALEVDRQIVERAADALSRESALEDVRLLEDLLAHLP
jgi:hypothetical protein